MSNLLRHEMRDVDICFRHLLAQVAPAARCGVAPAPPNRIIDVPRSMSRFFE
jgi:hypothetical protein